MNINNFCAGRNEGLYIVNILKENKGFYYWSFSYLYKIINGWKKPSPTCPPTYDVEIDGKKYKLANYRLIHLRDFSEVSNEYLVDANFSDLSTLIGEIINEITKNNLPNTLVWEYDEKNLLPNDVNIQKFSSNPDSCLPLKNMFILAGIINIQTSIANAMSGTDNQFQNFLNRIAKKTTNHFRAVWKEYRNVEFSLNLNSDQIIPGIKEKNTLDFARRSDGFKRFVTFLLMISVNVKTNHLINTLLLIDEPDNGLHPSGIRYLRDELIRISKKNYVVYSTHSTFMIDSGDIGRHYIVKKKNEITTIDSAKASNIADEEVLYNALGHSIFSILKENNIIFEGWNDKRLFHIALEKASSKLKRKFSNIGICHARGVKTIKAITPMFELANRNCIIVSDSDKPAKEQQKIYRQDKGFGLWKKYQEINSKIEAITGEDFIKNDFITKKIKSVLSGNNMPAFSQSILPDKKGKIAAILDWLIKNGMTQDQAKDTLIKIKNSIFEDLKPNNIEETYNLLLKEIPV